MTDYSKMSDFEINLAVASKFAANWRSFNSCVIGVPSSAQILIGNKWVLFDACNSWDDAGPIAEKKGITISAPMKYDNPALWLAYPASNSDLCVTSESPCRAICIVFLMMNEGE